MGKEIIFENSKMILWFHDDSKIVHHKFHDFIFNQELRDGLKKALEVMQKTGATKYLSDDRNNPVLKQEDMDWTASEWRPAMLDTEWKYWAIVKPEKTAGRMAMNKIVQEYNDKGVTVQFFSDAEAALTWLQSQE